MISHQKSLKDPRCDPWDGKMYQAIFSLVPCGHVSPLNAGKESIPSEHFGWCFTPHLYVQPCGMRHAPMPCGMARGMTSKQNPSSRVIPQPRHAIAVLSVFVRRYVGICRATRNHSFQDQNAKRCDKKTWKTYPRPQTSNTIFSTIHLKNNPFFVPLLNWKKKARGEDEFLPFLKRPCFSQSTWNLWKVQKAINLYSQKASISTSTFQSWNAIFFYPEKWVNWQPVRPKPEGSRYGCFYLHLYFFTKKWIGPVGLFFFCCFFFQFRFSATQNKAALFWKFTSCLLIWPGFLSDVGTS